MDAQPIGVDQVEGPEDVILDRGILYGSTRDGNIIRFSRPAVLQRAKSLPTSAGGRWDAIRQE